jgi:hypothetical protein
MFEQPLAHSETFSASPVRKVHQPVIWALAALVFAAYLWGLWSLWSLVGASLPDVVTFKVRGDAFTFHDIRHKVRDAAMLLFAILPLTFYIEAVAVGWALSSIRRILFDRNDSIRMDLANLFVGQTPLIPLIGKTAALSIAAIAWGLINFGLLLWLPKALVEQGYDMGTSSKLLAESALIAFPSVFFCAFIYSRWSTKWSLALMTTVTLAGLLWVLLLETKLGGSPVFPVALLIIGSNGLLAILLPYASECYPLKVRGRATGWVAACTKGGGVLAQSLSITALVPPLGIAALMIMAPIAVALFLIVRFGTETRGLDLRDLEKQKEAA